MILFVAWGTGGSEAINQLVKGLEIPYKILVCTDFGMCKIVSNNVLRLSEVEVLKYIKDNPPTLLINERSNGISFQKEITGLASELGIPNIIVTDIHIVKDRYIEEYIGELPNFITSVGNNHRDELIKQGIPEEKIIVIGNPAYERLTKVNYQPKFPSKPKIIYLSQGGNNNVPHRENIDIFYDMYKNIEHNFGKGNFEIHVKPHPMESSLKLQWIFFASRFKNVKVITEIDNTKDFLTDYLTEYDILIGIESTLQIQGYLLNIPTIFYEDMSKETFNNYNNKILPLNKRDDLEYKKYGHDKAQSIIREIYESFK